MTTTAELPRVTHAPSHGSSSGSSGSAAGGTSGGTELRALTGLRAVAAGWVVLFHFHFTALPGVALVTGLLGPLVTAGALGVDLFFVLSGFVIAYTYLEQLGPRLSARETGRFVWARACRIWPAYALVFHMFGIWLVARAVYGTDPDIAFQAVQPTLSVGEWIQQVFMVQLWDHPMFDGASWVGSTWSISAEWLAYLLFPLVAVVFHRLRNLPFGVLAAGALALMLPMTAAYLQVGNPYYPWSWLVRILCGFGAGILTYLAVRKLRRERAQVRRAASATASAVVVLVVAGLLTGELIGPGRGGAVIALFPVLVGALALADRGVAGWLARPALVYGGRISYALYLVHIPMFEVFWLALRRFGGYGGSTLLVADGVLAHVLGVVVLVATVPAAHLLYRYVEEPARQAMKDLPTRWGASVRARLTGWSRARGRTGAAVPAAAVAEVPAGFGELGPDDVPFWTEPLPDLPLVLTPAAGIPIDSDSARQDPATVQFVAVPRGAVALTAEKAVELSGASWPARTPERVSLWADLERHIHPVSLPEPEWSEPEPELAEQPERIDSEIARRDPETQAFPQVDPATHAFPQVDPATHAFPQVAAGEPETEAFVAVPAQPRHVERIHALRRADVRSPHPELAEELAGQLVGGPRGRHRAAKARAHAAPHIAGQRGPDRNGRSR